MCVCLSLSLSLSLSLYVCVCVYVCIFMFCVWAATMQLSPGMGSKTLSFFSPVWRAAGVVLIASRRQLGGGDT